MLWRNCPYIDTFLTLLATLHFSETEDFHFTYKGTQKGPYDYTHLHQQCIMVMFLKNGVKSVRPVEKKW